MAGILDRKPAAGLFPPAIIIKRAVGDRAFALAGQVVDMNYPDISKLLPIDEAEMPALKAQAQELIKWLRDEYPK